MQCNRYSDCTTTLDIKLPTNCICNILIYEMNAYFLQDHSKNQKSLVFLNISCCIVYVHACLLLESYLLRKVCVIRKNKRYIFLAVCSVS